MRDHTNDPELRDRVEFGQLQRGYFPHIQYTDDSGVVHPSFEGRFREYVTLDKESKDAGNDSKARREDTSG